MKRKFKLTLVAEKLGDTSPALFCVRMTTRISVIMQHQKITEKNSLAVLNKNFFKVHPRPVALPYQE
jgi:hypothetical protein